MKLTWGSQDIAGNFTSFEQEKRKKAAKAPGSRGPRSRGGKRVPSESTSGAAKLKSAKQAKPKLTTAPAPKVERMAAAKMSVTDVKQTVAPMSKLPAKRDVRLGSLLGRTGGKWHLGKRPGKG